VKTAKYGNNTVPAEGDAAVWWCAVLEGIQEEAELLLCFFFANAHYVKDALLNISVMDTNGTTANFIAIAENVIGIGSCLTRVCIERVNSLRLRSGKGLEHSGPPVIAQSQHT